MDQPRPIAASAVTSLVLSILGWLIGVPLAFLDYQNIAGATAGVGLIGPMLLGLLSALICMLGVIFGLVALPSIRRGERCGRGIGCAGIVLGGLALMTYLALVLVAVAGSDISQIR